MTIPVAFIPAHVAVSEPQAIAMLGLADGRTPRAARNAFWKFRRAHEIEPLPGFVFSVRKIVAAAEASESLKRQTKNKHKTGETV